MAGFLERRMGFGGTLDQLQNELRELKSDERMERKREIMLNRSSRDSKSGWLQNQKASYSKAAYQTNWKPNVTRPIHRKQAGYFWPGLAKDLQ